MRQESVDAGAVLVMPLVPRTLGSLLIAAIHRTRRHWPRHAITGGLLAVVTILFFNDPDPGTKIALGSLHLVAAALWIAAVRIVDRLVPFARPVLTTTGDKGRSSELR